MSIDTEEQYESLRALMCTMNKLKFKSASALDSHVLYTEGDNWELCGWCNNIVVDCSCDLTGGLDAYVGQYDNYDPG